VRQRLLKAIAAGSGALSLPKPSRIVPDLAESCSGNESAFGSATLKGLHGGSFAMQKVVGANSSSHQYVSVQELVEAGSPAVRSTLVLVHMRSQGPNNQLPVTTTTVSRGETRGHRETHGARPA
jgi:hypothetical protein